jgi:hypothetical protein
VVPEGVADPVVMSLRNGYNGFAEGVRSRSSARASNLLAGPLSFGVASTSFTLALVVMNALARSRRD